MTSAERTIKVFRTGALHWPVGDSVEVESPAEKRPASEHRRRRTPGGSPPRPAPTLVALPEEQDATRMPGLVPVRHGRMMVSPFTFYRGVAAIMAADLAATSVAGLEAQLCGS
jgi:Uncharacterized protein conserved in bacteria (DUF2252)